MKVCLDTNAYSKLYLTGHEELRSLLEEAEAVLLPSIVIGELAAGFEMGSKRALNFRMLNTFLDLPGTDIVPIDRDIAERYGRLFKALRANGTPIPCNDIWIAATSLELGARLVTYDLHFQVVPGLYIQSP